MFLIFFLKMAIDGEDLTSLGKLFHKALAKLSNKVGFNVPTLHDPTLLDRLAAHVG